MVGMVRVLVCVATFLSLVPTARADSNVEVTLNPLGMEVAEQIGTSASALAADARGKIDALFELSGLPRLLRSFADTGSFAARGLGVAYQPDPGDRIFGAVVSGAIAANAELASDRPLSATVLDYAIFGGLNLARWNRPRWTVFVNGSYASSTIRVLAGNIITLGGHALYQLMPFTRPSVARWTGVAVTTGLEYSRWSVGLASTYETHVVATGSAASASIHLSNAGTLEVLSQTATVPLEVSTGIRLAEVVGMYAGAGVAATTGSSAIEAVLDTTMSVNAARMTIGNAHVTASETSGPSTWTAHAFGGLELRARYLHLFAQGAIASDVRGVAVGLRAVF